MEEEILSRFLQNVEDSEVADEIKTVIAELSDEENFGDRERIKERILEEFDVDED